MPRRAKVKNERYNNFQMKKNGKHFINKAWRILNGILASFFFYMIADAWVEIFYFRNTEKQYYYFATIFVIPLITCLIVVFGWNLDDV